ncbi:hypothetical protein GOP47_0030443 [Adiantum capillus-veneris]|nr:hypothetical protein GOP47_0030443 [Adiantum capillus-veneris]
MSLLDGATAAHPFVLERRIHTDVQPLHSTRVRRRCCCCYAKAKFDKDEEEHLAPHRGFSIRVPTIPKLADIESARRLLEAAFQNLSFDMARIPIDSALQGLPFGIPKLSIPMPVLVLDITGFVVTKLKKPQKKVLEDLPVIDEGMYPRCAWPRTLKGAQLDEVANVGLLEDPHELEATLQIPVGPHCAWPRMTRRLAATSGFSSSSSVELYPHSVWPRGSIPANGAIVASEEMRKSRVASDISPSPCIIEGGPRCAWPRKSVSAKQSYYDSTDNKEEFEAEDQSGGKAPPAGCEEATELPRRMLATSVGLTVMNHLAKGSIVTSFFDMCSLLPGGSLGIAEEEDAAMDVGRRALLVFIKDSGN